MGLGVSYGAGFGADEKNVSQNIYNLTQGGLTLGAKDYYLNNDAATVAIREAYKAYLGKMFQLYGFSAADAVQVCTGHLPARNQLLPLFPRAAPSFVTHRPTTTR